MATVAKPPTPLHVRGAPEPLQGGPLGLLRFLRSHGMLNHKYARLLARWAWLKLRWGGRLQTDGICFVGPGVKLEIGRDAVLRLGRWSWIGHGTKIRVHEGEVEIGAKTVFGQECTISAFQHVSIGRECIVADRVMMIDFDHGVVETERPIRLQGIYKRDVQRRPQLLDRLRRLHPARRHGRRQRDHRDLDGRHQGRARQRGRRRRPRPRAADAPRARDAALGVTALTPRSRGVTRKTVLIGKLSGSPPGSRPRGRLPAALPSAVDVRQRDHHVSTKPRPTATATSHTRR